MWRSRIFFNSRYHPTQVSIYLISIMVLFIFLAFMVINIGKTAKDQTYADNAADAGALAAASVMAYAFNYVANANAGSQGENFKENWENISKEYDEHFQQAHDIYSPHYLDDSAEAQAQTCTICTGCSTITGTAATKAWEASFNAGQYAKEMDSLIKNGFKDVDEDYQETEGDGVVPSGAQKQQAFIEALRKRVQDDGKSGEDLYQNALYAGYIFNFYNSGVSHRLDRMNQRRWSAFLEEITPDNVNNCEEKTFTWWDGAARYHSVTAMICIDDARSYKLEITQDNRDKVKQNLDKARENAANAREEAGNVDGQWATKAVPLSGEAEYRAASACCDCCQPCVIPCGISGECPLCCPEKDAAGDGHLKSADSDMSQAESDAQQAKQGLDGSDQKDYDNKDASEPDIIKHIVDINHSRKVYSLNIQFHMGGPIKGMRGDVDFPTFYLPVQSQAIADFNGGGDIEGGQAAFDARLE